MFRSPTKPQQQPPAAGPSRMGPPGVSEYHHRHRPDPPPTTNARPAPSAGGAAARQAALLAASAAEPAPLPDPPIKPNMSSGSSDTLFDTPTAQRRPPQGNPPPDGTVSGDDSRWVDILTDQSSSVSPGGFGSYCTIGQSVGYSCCLGQFRSSRFTKSRFTAYTRWRHQRSGGQDLEQDCRQCRHPGSREGSVGRCRR